MSESVDESTGLPSYGPFSQADHVFYIGKPTINLHSGVTLRARILEYHPSGIVVLDASFSDHRPLRVFVPFAQIEDINEDYEAVDEFVAKKRRDA